MSQLAKSVGEASSDSLDTSVNIESPTHLSSPSPRFRSSSTAAHLNCTEKLNFILQKLETVIDNQSKLERLSQKIDTLMSQGEL